MAWRLDGTYFESCSCDAVCPCTWSALTVKATLDRCRALLAYHVESGEIDGVDVSGLSFALFLDTPPVMAEGNWRVGVYLDDAASDSQAEQLGAVLSGQLGGPPAMLGPLISEMLGVERRPSPTARTAAATMSGSAMRRTSALRTSSPSKATIRSS